MEKYTNFEGLEGYVGKWDSYKNKIRVDDNRNYFRDDEEVVICSKKDLDNYITLLKIKASLDKKVAELWKTRDADKAREIITSMKPYLVYLKTNNLIEEVRYYILEIVEYENLIKEMGGRK